MAQLKKSRFYTHLKNFKGGQCYKNKRKMARFLKFKFLITIKLNFNRGPILQKKIKFWCFQKVEKIQNKIVKFEFENFEHLCPELFENNNDENNIAQNGVFN